MVHTGYLIWKFFFLSSICCTRLLGHDLLLADYWIAILLYNPSLLTLIESRQNISQLSRSSLLHPISWSVRAQLCLLFFNDSLIALHLQLHQRCQQS